MCAARALLLVALAFLFVWPASAGGSSMTISVLPDGTGAADVEQAARAAGLSDSVVFAGQSFQVTIGKQSLELFAGKGMSRDLKSTCFVVTRTGASIHFLPTIGAGDYDTTECRGVLETRKVGYPERLLIIYDSVSPNYSVKEPVVIAIDANEPVKIDAETSRSLSLAGVTSGDAAVKLLTK